MKITIKPSGRIVAVCLFVLLISFVSIAIVWLVQLLWNFVMAGVFGLPGLTFLQTLALYALLGLLNSFIRIRQRNEP